MYPHRMHQPATTIGPVNRLEQAASSYLRSARHQPVEWHPWGEAAFTRAQSEDKPILLDIGAVWCHWCHVMDRESYEDPELARIINEHYIAVKVDRDERPDVDARYQAAVSAISGQGGWPLTGFLTPDGRPYFGGTYFPRDDRYGRPGFGRVLLTMAQVWRERRDEALESATSVMAAIEHNESFSGRGGELSLALVDKLANSAIAQFDPRNGGFGAQPKFPHPAALDLLLQLAGIAATLRPAKFSPSRSKRWRAGESMTRLRADSIATVSMSAGSFLISRRCSMTTPSCCAITCTVSRALRAKISVKRRARSSYWLDAVMTDREPRRLLCLAGCRYQSR